MCLFDCVANYLIRDLTLSKKKKKMEQRRGKKRSPMMRMLKIGCGSSYVVSIGPAKLRRSCALFLDQNDIYLVSGCSTSAMQFQLVVSLFMDLHFLIPLR